MTQHEDSKDIRTDIQMWASLTEGLCTMWDCDEEAREIIKQNATEIVTACDNLRFAVSGKVCEE